MLSARNSPHLLARRAVFVRIEIWYAFCEGMRQLSLSPTNDSEYSSVSNNYRKKIIADLPGSTDRGTDLGASAPLLLASGWFWPIMAANGQNAPCPPSAPVVPLNGHIPPPDGCGLGTDPAAEATAGIGRGPAMFLNGQPPPAPWPQGTGLPPIARIYGLLESVSVRINKNFFLTIICWISSKKKR